MEHELKCWPGPFEAIRKEIKLFEWRKNDRDFKDHDCLHLREYDPVREEYTGRELKTLVTYIAHGRSFGIPKGWCVMSIARPHLVIKRARSKD